MKQNKIDKQAGRVHELSEGDACSMDAKVIPQLLVALVVLLPGALVMRAVDATRLRLAGGVR